VAFPASAHPAIRAARRWIGTPFAHQGRVRGDGVDCVGLIVGVAHDLGLTAYDNRNYARLPDCRLLVAELDAHMDFIPPEDAAEGDVVVIAWDAEPIHTALYTGRTVIHALESIGRVAEHRFPAAWRERVVAAYRYRGLAWPS
jgi:cell wall-associated NlpC family hydrolase